MGNKVFYSSNVAGDSGYCALFGEGKMLKFSFNGKYVGECPIDVDVLMRSYPNAVDCISILQSTGGGRVFVEIGVQVGEEFSAFVSSLAYPEILERLMNIQGYLVCANRSGTQGKVFYQQILMCFPQGRITRKSVEELFNYGKQ